MLNEEELIRIGLIAGRELAAAVESEIEFVPPGTYQYVVSRPDKDKMSHHEDMRVYRKEEAVYLKRWRWAKNEKDILEFLIGYAPINKVLVISLPK